MRLPLAVATFVDGAGAFDVADELLQGMLLLGENGFEDEEVVDVWDPAGSVILAWNVSAAGRAVVLAGVCIYPDAGISAPLAALAYPAKPAH